MEGKLMGRLILDILAVEKAEPLVRVRKRNG